MSWCFHQIPEIPFLRGCSQFRAHCHVHDVRSAPCEAHHFCDHFFTFGSRDFHLSFCHWASQGPAAVWCHWPSQAAQCHQKPSPCPHPPPLLHHWWRYWAQISVKLPISWLQCRLTTSVWPLWFLSINHWGFFHGSLLNMFWWRILSEPLGNQYLLYPLDLCFSTTYLAPSRTVVDFVSYNFSCQNLCPGTDVYPLVSPVSQHHHWVCCPWHFLSQNCLCDCCFNTQQARNQARQAGDQHGWAKTFFSNWGVRRKRQWKQGQLT